MRIAVVWYSRTGTTARAARQAAALLQDAGHEAVELSIRPLAELPYPLWLALSFVPGSRFPLREPVPSVGSFGGCLLAVPKWTFSCPPVNGFLARCEKLPPTAVLVTCGGWDQDRYLAALERRLVRCGVTVLGRIAIKRRRVEAGETPQVLKELLAAWFPPDAA
jgi:hypothetical protein